jgi:hypothetical protein
MSEAPDTIRSYQRIFTPDRRLYSIEGHPLPVPGGVPLRWLGYASTAFVLVLVLGAHSTTIAVLGAGIGGLVGLGAGGRSAGIVAAAAGFLSVELGGWMISALDWPLRLIVIPGAVATLGTQATPDGRRAHRFAFSWLLLRLAPGRQSLGRGLAHHADAAESVGLSLWVGRDEHSPTLPPGVIHGPAEITFTEPVEARKRGRRRVRVSCLGWRARRGAVVRTLSVAEGERVEVRP